MNPNEKTVKEIETATKQLRYEGKASKELFDWFAQEFKRKQTELGNKQRHKEQEHPALGIYR